MYFFVYVGVLEIENFEKKFIIYSQMERTRAILSLSM